MGMRNRSSNTPRDVGQSINVLAKGAADHETKDPAAVALGRKGGLKGGRARAEALSKRRRSEIARKAAAARWKT
jgi:hypothetical protein